MECLSLPHSGGRAVCSESDSRKSSTCSPHGAACVLNVYEELGGNRRDGQLTLKHLTLLAGPGLPWMWRRLVATTRPNEPCVDMSYDQFVWHRYAGSACGEASDDT